MYRFLGLICLWIPLQYGVSGTTGKLVGTVTDVQTGAPLPGANIILEGTDLGAATDAQGSYLLFRVPPGTYSLRTTMIGYQEVLHRDIRVRIDLTTRIDIRLKPGVIGMEEVTVTADRPLIQPDITYSQENISSESIDALPVEEFEDVVALQSGVVIGSDNAIHIRGGRGSEIAYLVDGISVTDPFSAGMAIEIENNAIQELQIISGTFNAEYGQAMSGVINIVTKDGNFHGYHGRILTSMGDFISRDTLIFPHLGTIDLRSLQDLQGSFNGPVPFLGGKGSFFLSGRYFYDEGSLYGERRYVPESFVWSDSLKEFIQEKEGDGKVFPMDWSLQGSGQAKLSLKLGDRTRLSINGLASNTEYRSYNHKFRYNPDGDYQRFRFNRSLIVKLDQSLSASTYVLLSYSFLLNRNQYYVYEDPGDSRYNVDPDVFRIAVGYNFYVGGLRMGHYDRQSEIWTGKIELVSQVNPLHQIRLGMERRGSRIRRESYTILYNEDTGYRPEVPDVLSPQNDYYQRQPFEWSGYLQDKIETQDIILNLGIRYDYFDPRWKVLSDPSDPNIHQPVKPINTYVDENGDGVISPSEMRQDNLKSLAERTTYWYRSARSKDQLSPRLALAFPITDKGVLHFSYGHFFQIPPFSFLYANPDFEVTPGLSTTMGNADLEPERTIQYEVGFQQQVGRYVGLDVTGFYKDIRNLTGQKIVDTFVGGDRYALYINRDYGNVRGITVAIEKQPAGFLSGTLDYTYQIAEGNASDQNTAYYDELSGNEPEKHLIALDWDQRHTLNATVTFHLGRGSGISLISQYWSGTPYTPAFAGTRIAFENSEVKPEQVNLDLRSFWNFSLFGIQASLQANIYNLLDRRNESIVYNDTGRSSYSLIPTFIPQEQTFNTLDEYLRRPDYYSSPRQVKIGLSLKF